MKKRNKVPLTSPHKKVTLTMGERFKDARIVHNKNGRQTMEEVASLLGIAKSTLSDIENDKRDPGAEVIKMLAQHYGVSSDYLLGLSDTKTSDTDVQSIISFTGLTDDCINTLHAMHEDDLAQDYECSDIGSNKPILDLFSDILHDFYIDHRLIAKYYIALRRNIINGGEWYSNNTNGKTSECDHISPDFSCMKIAREIEKALRRKYRVKQDEVAAGYHKEFIMDYDEEGTMPDNEEDD